MKEGEQSDPGEQYFLLSVLEEKRKEEQTYFFLLFILKKASEKSVKRRHSGRNNFRFVQPSGKMVVVFWKARWIAEGDALFTQFLRYFMECGERSTLFWGFLKENNMFSLCLCNDANGNFGIRRILPTDSVENQWSVWCERVFEL